MSDERVKVVGYAKRIFFNDGIEYRNFSDDLVGQQSATGNSSLTFNNFITTTNLNARIANNFPTSDLSDFITLDTLTSNDGNLNIPTINSISLNADYTKLDGYAYFGSLKEYIRVSLEDIIMRWPASLHVREISVLDDISTGITTNNISYDSVLDTTTFEIETNFIENKYGLNFLQNGTIINSFATENDIKQISANFSEYAISIDNVEYNVLEFTGATQQFNDVLKVVVKGNPFTGSTYTGSYHFKPNNKNRELYFKSLDRLQGYLLNRLVIPSYTSTFTFPVRTDGGVLLYNSETITWPVSDGYNLDFNNTLYTDYVNSIIDIADNYDDNKTDLIHRFLTAESISSFDTVSDEDDEDSPEQKITKLLRVHGRGYDEIKQYIDGISYANTVTYDKKNNIPDTLIKILGRTLGWEVTSSLLDNDVINYFLTTGEAAFSGQSRSLTLAESEVELWRRLIMNSSWLFKSKGTRKAIEFILNFIGTPDGLIEFKEHLYVADRPVDVDLISEIFEERGEPFDISELNFDSDGYPKVLEDTDEMYFQKGGLWYRETAGPNSNIYLLTGNNPHIGPYDGGEEYINQFNCLVPNFEPIEITNEIFTTGSTEFYINYNEGFVNQCVENCVSGGTVIIDTVPATLNGNLLEVKSGNSASSYGNSGGRFYEPLSNYTLPIEGNTSNNDLADSSGTTVAVDQTVVSSPWTTLLENIGVWNNDIDSNATTTGSLWYGFSKCINVESSGTYVIGLAADNFCRFKLNGEPFVELKKNDNFKFWHMFEVELIGGTNIIEMEGKNDTSTNAAFGAEIYNAPLSTISGITNNVDLDAVTIFSTGDLVDSAVFDLGEDNGYSCPPGYSLNICADGAPTCTLISGSTGNTCQPDVYFSVLNSNNDNNRCYTLGLDVIDDPNPIVERTDCGCPIDDCDEALEITITKNNEPILGDGVIVNNCNISSFELESDGLVLFTLGDGTITNGVSTECCTSSGFNTYEQVAQEILLSTTQTINNLSNGLYVIDDAIRVIGGGFTDVTSIGNTMTIIDGSFNVVTYKFDEGLGTSVPENIIDIETEILAGTSTVTDLNNYLVNILGLQTEIGCHWNTTPIYTAGSPASTTTPIAPVLSLVSTTDATCGVDDGTMTIGLTDGTLPVNLQIVDEVGNITNETFTTYSNLTIDNLEAGTYIIDGTDINTLTSNTLTVDIGSGDAVILTVNVVEDTINPSLSNMVVSVTGGVPSYDIRTFIGGTGTATPFNVNLEPSDGTTWTFFNVTSGNYYVSVTDGNGCEDTVYNVVVP